MRYWLSLVITTVFAASAFACTTFVLTHEGHHYFGRNYDWVTGNGMVIVNPRSVQKLSGADTSLQWISKYGSISFNQYGKEYPTGGMNEKGLVVELMWLDETQYPEKDDRKAIGVLQWIQYQLDNCASVEEVIATDLEIRINKEGSTPLHYLIADASGHSAVIEFLNGKLITHKGSTMPFAVLTNTAYQKALQLKMSDGSKAVHPDNSVERFVKACSMLEAFQGVKNTNPVDFSFSILKQVAQGSHTQWSIVYDINNRLVHFSTGKNGINRKIDLGKFSFNCSEGSMAVSIDEGTGDITGGLIPLSFEANEALIRKSVEESRRVISIPEPAVKQVANAYHTGLCSEKI